MSSASHDFPMSEATPKQIALAFIDFIVKPQNSKDPSDQSVASLSEHDRQSIRYETMLLNGWINEYATWYSFHNKPEYKAILEVYYSLIETFAQKDPNWSTFDIELRIRIPVYAQAFGDGLQKSQLEEVGWEFARFCGHPDEVRFQMIGVIEFAANYAATQRFLNSLKVIL